MNFLIRNKEVWKPIDIRIEGGGVIYGLLPIEAGYLLGLNNYQLSATIIHLLIDKKVISLNDNQIIIENEIHKVLKTNSTDDIFKKFEIKGKLK